MASKLRLTEQQVHHYNEEGYVVYNQSVFPEAKFNGLKDYFEELLEAQVRAGKRPEAMDKPHFLHPRLFEWALDDTILDLVEPLLGPDFHLFATHFICKPQGDGKRVPWHEDSAYWKGIMHPIKALTVWLAIDPSTCENGCMFVVPRSHVQWRKGYSDYKGVDISKSVFPTEIVEPQQHGDLGAPCILKPNECSLHDCRMIHGSEPNTSAIRRCGFTMRFVPADVRLSPEWESCQGFYPARGRDKAGNTLLDPTRTYPQLAEETRIKRVH